MNKSLRTSRTRLEPDKSFSNPLYSIDQRAEKEHGISEQKDLFRVDVEAQRRSNKIQATYEEELLKPFLEKFQNLSGMGCDEELITQVNTQMTALYSFFMNLYNEDEKEKRMLKEALKAKEEQVRQLKIETFRLKDSVQALQSHHHVDHSSLLKHNRHGGGLLLGGGPSSSSAKFAPESYLRANRSNLHGRGQSMDSDDRGTGIDVDGRTMVSSQPVFLVHLPLPLPPRNPVWNFYRTWLFSFKDKRTTWLAAIWVLLFCLAIALLVGLLVPWKDLRRVTFSSPLMPLVPISCGSLTSSSLSSSSSVSSLSTTVSSSFADPLNETDFVADTHTAARLMTESSWTTLLTNLCSSALTEDALGVGKSPLSSLSSPTSSSPTSSSPSSDTPLSPLSSFSSTSVSPSSTSDSSSSTTIYVPEADLTTNASTSSAINGGTAWKTWTGVAELNVTAADGRVNFQFALNREVSVNYAVVPYDALSAAVVAKVNKDSFNISSSSGTATSSGSRRLLRKLSWHAHLATRAAVFATRQIDDFSSFAPSSPRKLQRLLHAPYSRKFFSATAVTTLVDSPPVSFNRDHNEGHGAARWRRNLASSSSSSTESVQISTSDLTFETLASLATGAGKKISDLAPDLLATAVSCGTVLYGNKNANYTLSLPVIGVEETSTTLECEKVYNLTASYATTYPLPTAVFRESRCLRCPFIRSNTTYVLFLSAGNKHRNTGVKHVRFRVVD